MLQGIDISHHQKPDAVDWTAAKAKGIHFAYVRCSYGDRPDAEFKTHAKRALDEGLIVGAYHFFRSARRVKPQVDVFTDSLYWLVQEAGDRMIVPMLDVEDNQRFDGPISIESYNASLALMFEDVSSCYKLGVYTTQAFWRAIGNPSWLSDPSIPLWVAHWGATEPSVPLDKDWTIWQHSVRQGTGIYPGELDLNIATSRDALEF